MDRPAVVFAALLLCSGVALKAGLLSDKADQAKSRNEIFVEGSDGWRFLPAELRFVDKLASPDLNSEVRPAVEAIADFSAQLKNHGVALVLLPVPPKALLHGAKLGVSDAEEQKMRAGWLQIMNDLSSRGVDVVDLLVDYSAAKESMFCQRDTHWSGPGIGSAAAKLIPALKAAGVSASASMPQPRWEETPIQGDLGGEPEKVKLHFVKEAASRSATAPVLVLGDSHALVFHQGGDMHTSDAGLPEQMATVLGGMPEVMGVRGSGATSCRLQLARAIRSKPDYLGHTKVVVWVFAGREFTEADMWKKLPVFPPKAGSAL